MYGNELIYILQNKKSNIQRDEPECNIAIHSHVNTILDELPSNIYLLCYILLMSDCGDLAHRMNSKANSNYQICTCL